MIVDDDLYTMFVQELLKKNCRCLAIVDACHSASAFDLPFNYDFEGKQWTTEKGMKADRLDDLKSSGYVILLSGCQDNQTSGDTSRGGIFTTSFYTLVNSADCGDWSIEQILDQAIKDALKKKNTQNPNMSSSCKLDVKMKFKDFVGAW